MNRNIYLLLILLLFPIVESYGQILTIKDNGNTVTGTINDPNGIISGSATVKKIEIERNSSSTSSSGIPSAATHMNNTRIYNQVGYDNVFEGVARASIDVQESNKKFQQLDNASEALDKQIKDKQQQSNGNSERKDRFTEENKITSNSSENMKKNVLEEDIEMKEIIELDNKIRAIKEKCPQCASNIN